MKLTVDEGDEVTTGQVVGEISSPGNRSSAARRANASAQSKKALAEAVAIIAQRKSDLEFSRTDDDRAKALIERGNISQQVTDQRRTKYETAEAALVAANAQRDEAAIDSDPPGARLTKKWTPAVPACSCR